jgi:hypothetical protein
MVRFPLFLVVISALTLTSAAEFTPSCSLTATVAFEPFSSFEINNLLTSITSSVELQKDGKTICKADSDTDIPRLDSSKEQKICAAAGMSLKLLDINAPATIVGATVLGEILKVASHFQVIDEFTQKKMKVSLKNPKMKCKLFPETECSVKYRVDFQCPCKKSAKVRSFVECIMTLCDS